MSSRNIGLHSNDFFFFLSSSKHFYIDHERNEAKENFLNKKYRNDEKDEHGPYTNNLRSSSEAVGMEKLIPSLRQRQQIGNPINTCHEK